jgi:isopropylmalate/homocitrate/citramalate synthase
MKLWMLKVLVSDKIQYINNTYNYNNIYDYYCSFYIYLLGLNDNNIVLGKHSGRHAFKSRLVELGYIMNDQELNAAFLR